MGFKRRLKRPKALSAKIRQVSVGEVRNDFGHHLGVGDGDGKVLKTHRLPVEAAELIDLAEHLASFDIGKLDFALASDNFSVRTLMGNRMFLEVELDA